MKRTINFTGRKKIPQKAVSIRILQDRTFEPTWDGLSEIGMPNTATVYVEAFASGSVEVERHHLGTVGTPDLSLSNRELKNLPDEAVAFNFKVVDETGRLLGIAENITPIGKNEEGGQQPLLPVDPTDLGDQVWSVKFGNNRPWLQINNLIPNIMNLIKTDKGFFSLVYPAVIRQIMTHLLFVEDVPDCGPEADSSDWKVLWLRWGAHLLPDEDVPKNDSNEEQKIEWIDNVVRSFCKKHSMRDKFITRNEEGDKK